MIGVRGQGKTNGVALLFLAVLCTVSCRSEEVVVPRVIVLEMRVAAGVNDAEEEAGGEVVLSSGSLELGGTAAAQEVGVRFAGVPVPSGANIRRAHLQFQSIRFGADEASFTVTGAADGRAVFSRTSRDLSSRERTTARVTWRPPPWTVIGEQGAAQRTPELGPIVQEIVDGSAWTSGSDLAFLLTGSGRRVATAFERDADAAPLLHIEYSVDDRLTVDAFTVGPGDATAGGAVGFSWSVSTPDRGPLRCRLDADGDGEWDDQQDDCLRGTVRHVFSTPGRYLARFEVESDGATRSASVPVAVSTPDSVTLIVAGDVVCDPESPHFRDGEGTATNCRMKATSDLALQADPDAVAIVGDAQYEDGQLWKFERAYDPSWGRLKAVTRPAVGNHEYNTPGAAGYFDYFGAVAGDRDKGYYSYDLGAWHIVVLNSNCTKIGGCGRSSEQMAWLQQDLADHPALCTLAYWHHPLFSSGEIGSIHWTDDFWDALHRAGAEIVLVGHDHHYERFAPQTAAGVLDPERGIREFLVGNGGKNLTPIERVIANSEASNSGTYGVLELTLHPAGYDWAFRAASEGTFTDTGTGRCH